MTIELLQAVDWNAWKQAGGTVASQADMPRPTVPDYERVALLVLSLGQFTSKKELKIVRMALREIEQAVLQAEQDIDYL